MCITLHMEEELFVVFFTGLFLWVFSHKNHSQSLSHEFEIVGILGKGIGKKKNIEREKGRDEFAKTNF